MWEQNNGNFWKHYLFKIYFLPETAPPGNYERLSKIWVDEYHYLIIF